MASGLIIVPNYMPALNRNGVPYNGALLWFYLNRTTTPTTVYLDPGLSVPALNPLPSDSSGVFPLIYGDTTNSYTIVVTTADGAPIKAYDDVIPSLGSVTGTASVATRTALKALATGAGLAYLTESGREGDFVFRLGDYSASVALDTLEGIYIKADAVPANVGAWVRADLSHPYAEWWGAVGNGVTNDTAAYTAALSLVNTVYLKSRQTYVLNNLALNSGKAIISDPTKATVKYTGSSAINIQPFLAGVAYVNPTTVKNIIFDGSGATSGASALYARTDLGIVFKVDVLDCMGIFCEHFWNEGTHATNYVNILRLNNIVTYYPSGVQINSKRSRGGVLIEHVHIDMSYNTTPDVTWESIHIADFVGLQMSYVEITGAVNTSATYQSAAVGINIVGNVGGSNSVWLSNVLSDNGRGPGIYITNVNDLYFDNITVYQNFGAQIVFTSCNNVVGSNLIAHGAHGVTGAATANNVSFATCTYVNITNFTSTYSTGSGVVRNASTNMIFSNCRFTNNDSYNLIDVGACDANIINGLTMNNKGGAHDAVLIGTGSYLLNYFDGTGTYTASTVGLVSPGKNIN